MGGAGGRGAISHRTSAAFPQLFRSNARVGDPTGFGSRFGSCRKTLVDSDPRGAQSASAGVISARGSDRNGVTAGKTEGPGNQRLGSLPGPSTTGGRVPLVSSVAENTAAVKTPVAGGGDATRLSTLLLCTVPAAGGGVLVV